MTNAEGEGERKEARKKASRYMQICGCANDMHTHIAKVYNNKMKSTKCVFFGCSIVCVIVFVLVCM